MGLVRCTDPFSYTDHKSGQNRVVRAGDLLDDKDVRIKGREQWFEQLEDTAERVTTRTGTARRTGRTVKKTDTAASD
jgi:hypothetical protein